MLNLKCQFWYLPQRASLARVGSHIVVNSEDLKTTHSRYWCIYMLWFIQSVNKVWNYKSNTGLTFCCGKFLSNLTASLQATAESPMLNWCWLVYDVTILDREERWFERGVLEAIWERIEQPFPQQTRQGSDFNFLTFETNHWMTSLADYHVIYQSIPIQHRTLCGRFEKHPTQGECKF